MDMKIKEQPILEGRRLKLRAVEKSDAGLMALYAGDKRVAQNLAVVPHPYPPGAAEAFIETVQSGAANEILWVMDLASEGRSELIGVISLTAKDEGAASIGYWVAPQLWGGGFASEAADLVVEYARTTGFKALEAHVHQTNIASAKVLTNAGFGYVGDSEQHAIYHGRMVPTWDYRLVL